MNDSNQFYLDPSTLVAHCPSCDSEKVSSRMETIHFDHGDGSNHARLSASVPIHKCGACGLEYLDAIAEGIKHASVCRHLGIHTPAEIVQLRKRYGLTRAKFAELTKIGEATLGRWERGALTQNIAYDQLLYLLQFSDNVCRLEHRVADKSLGKSGNEVAAFGEVTEDRFRGLTQGEGIEIAVKKSYRFRLFTGDAA